MTQNASEALDTVLKITFRSTAALLATLGLAVILAGCGQVSLEQKYSDCLKSFRDSGMESGQLSPEAVCDLAVYGKGN